MNIFELQGVRGDVVKDDLSRSLTQSKLIYWERMSGITKEWSATTRCEKCGEWWMWGVKDNLRFTCDKCKRNGV